MNYNKEKRTEEYVFFFESCSPFSQWHESAFQDVEGNWYTHAEQYMMAEKARLFGDMEALDQIMDADTPKEQKALGRKVKGFDAKTWDDHKFNIVYRGNKLKFMQNHMLYKYLMDTGNKILVEASPFDLIYGIGMRKEDKGVENPSNWKGENLLGRAIEAVREEIKTLMFA